MKQIVIIAIVVISLFFSEKSYSFEGKIEKSELNEPKIPTVEYILVWSDEFDKEGAPDPTKWGYEEGFRRNLEDQWYQKDNAWCENGFLIIEGRKEQKPNPWYDPSSTDWKKTRKTIEYTSSSIHTKGLHSWQYGRFEIRARIDAQSGVWPAIWTLGISGSWPSNGEVDIMEYYQGKILANFAWCSANPSVPIWDGFKEPISDYFKDPNWADEFHTWVLEWTPDQMKIYVDDQLLNEVDLSKTINSNDGKNPFHQPHYLLLNLAIGGKAGGDPSAVKFPSRYLVDYVRVYKNKMNYYGL